MPSTEEYPDELRDHAVLLVMDVKDEAGNAQRGVSAGSASSTGSTGLAAGVAARTIC